MFRFSLPLKSTAGQRKGEQIIVEQSVQLRTLASTELAAVR